MDSKDIVGICFPKPVSQAPRRGEVLNLELRNLTLNKFAFVRVLGDVNSPQ